MTIYKNPVKGKYGIRSGVSKRMCFGICSDSKKECREQLRNKVGYYNSLKYRFFVSEWYDNDLEEHQEYLKNIQEQKEYERKERKYRKECFKWVEENKHRLKDEYIQRLDNASYNIKQKKSSLEKWLTMPERIKEFNNDSI